jgi:LysR family transcriptional regulator, hca operon transcriptional activator
MELRHLRYFVAVAEEGSLTNAAERRLHTAQPSLSRQIRDLEYEVGVKLLEASSSPRPAARFSIMPGWHYFRSKPQAKRRAVRRSRRRRRSRLAS